jgi:hypothetical protein
MPAAGFLGRTRSIPRVFVTFVGRVEFKANDISAKANSSAPRAPIRDRNEIAPRFFPTFFLLELFSLALIDSLFRKKVGDISCLCVRVRVCARAGACVRVSVCLLYVSIY